jgi:hypothetical protein
MRRLRPKKLAALTLGAVVPDMEKAVSVNADTAS